MVLLATMLGFYMQTSPNKPELNQTNHEILKRVASSYIRSKDVKNTIRIENMSSNGLRATVQNEDLKKCHQVFQYLDLESNYDTGSYSFATLKLSEMSGLDTYELRTFAAPSSEAEAINLQVVCSENEKTSTPVVVKENSTRKNGLTILLYSILMAVAISWARKLLKSASNS